MQWLGWEGGLQSWLGGEGGHHLEVFAGFATEKLVDAMKPHGLHRLHGDGQQYQTAVWQFSPQYSHTLGS